MSTASNFTHPSQEAIIFASWIDRDEIRQQLVTPNIILPLLGKSLLQRAVEQLVRLGCRHIRVILGTEASPIRELLQSGERWGCRLSYHYLAPQGTFGAFMRSIDVNAIEHYWLADAAQLPGIQSHCSENSPAGTYLCWDQDGKQRWSGWGRFSGAWLLSRSIDLKYAALEESLANDEWLERHAVERPLAVETLADVLSTYRRLLANAAEQAEIGRNCTIHPSARIVAPAWIGEQVKIGANAVIGPGTMIGAGSFIDEGSHVRESAVMADTYVGKGLELQHSIAQGGSLANIPLGAIVALQDAHLLAGLKGNTAKMSFDRPAAAVLHIGLSVLYAALRIGIPNTDSRRWLTHFRDTFYPGLRDVFAGKLSLVGPAAQNSGMPRQRRHGLLNDALLSGESVCDPDLLLASDLLAQARQGELRATMSYLRNYLSKVFGELIARPRKNSTATQ